jgi:HSP20 family protein
MSLIKFFDDLGYTRGLSSLWDELDYSKFSFPSVDLYSVQGGLELRADLPGFNKETINLNVSGNVLTLSGERETFGNNEMRTLYYTERRRGKFIRRIKLPFVVDSNMVYATFNDGVLTVTLPTPNVEENTRITIN